MTADIIYSPTGRGAWSYKKPYGGTLNSAGTDLGQYYVLAAPGKRKVGTTGAWADAESDEVSISHYAVYRAVVAIQKQVGVTPTGIFDQDTSEAVKVWQKAHKLIADGVYGRVSAKNMWSPIAIAAANAVDSAHPDLADLVCGHIAYESLWDPGAVGGLVPADLGLGQINGPAHPGMTEAQRLDPVFACTWVAGFVEANLVAMNYVVRDAVAAYNLGQGGARQWIKAGRPDIWTRVVDIDGQPVEVTTKVKQYIDSVLAAF